MSIAEIAQASEGTPLPQLGAYAPPLPDGKPRVIADYQIVQRETAKDLELAVREALKQGWRPIGAFVLMPHSWMPMYGQAMALELDVADAVRQMVNEKAQQEIARIAKVKAGKTKGK
jgi:hypothetical protein